MPPIGFQTARICLMFFFARSSFTGMPISRAAEASWAGRVWLWQVMQPRSLNGTGMVGISSARLRATDRRGSPMPSGWGQVLSRGVWASLAPNCFSTSIFA